MVKPFIHGAHAWVIIDYSGKRGSHNHEYDGILNFTQRTNVHDRIKHLPFHDDLNALKKSFDKVLSEKGDQYYLRRGGKQGAG